MFGSLQHTPTSGALAPPLEQLAAAHSVLALAASYFLSPQENGAFVLLPSHMLEHVTYGAQHSA